LIDLDFVACFKGYGILWTLWTKWF